MKKNAKKVNKSYKPLILNNSFMIWAKILIYYNEWNKKRTNRKQTMNEQKENKA